MLHNSNPKTTLIIFNETNGKTIEFERLSENVNRILNPWTGYYNEGYYEDVLGQDTFGGEYIASGKIDSNGNLRDINEITITKTN